MQSRVTTANMGDPNNQRNVPNNRLFLNFGNDRFSPNLNDRAYPTTPSTFPQPVFSQGQAQQSLPVQQPYSAGFGATPGYFMNNPYPQQNQYAQQQASSQSAYGQRGAINDPTNGLAHQFSNQNLGNGRSSPHASRPPPPQRPRTAGATGQQNYSYLNAPMPSLVPQQHLPDFQPVPERNINKYGSAIQNSQKRCYKLAEDFFKDSVKRARDRNLRLVYISPQSYSSPA
jgi:protein-serine/threonine kinase